jgi:hypothetical protein
VGPSRAEKNRKNYLVIDKLPKIESIPTNFVEKLLVCSVRCEAKPGEVCVCDTDTWSVLVAAMRRIM